MVRPKKDARLIDPSLEVHEKKQVEENKPHLKNDELLKNIIAYSIKIDYELSMIDFSNYSIKQRIKRLLEIAYEDGLKQQGIEHE
jgi:hypothetical protein